ncbi:hypothetical protein N5P18_10160 [Janibacter terrae]|jgi:phosphotransferase system  glucose/maltose/N-acetylglucosamine-specific IIC component|uniref:Lysyl-tRNA synthetase n=1 Tax=Janibacter terrae TaxID=103817 RepID=A0ABZ2F9V1_9MICO|nr:hypothetical protein [Janibacter terrae]MBA4084129.1 hypothetical protein [Kytococcus sp.]HBO54791.1 hypothetical protein [Janibacter terrae]HCE59901.1 hypothetical protein [Janibacter terrae]
MEFINEYWPYAAALLPTVGVAFLFYWIIRYMLEADRSERKALAKWNAEQRKDAHEKKDISGDSPQGGE